MWQEKFEKHRDEGFTVVGIALDADGIAAAKLYYDKFGVTIPALVDPNYATGFGVVPLTFFVDEHGVVQDAKNWEQRIEPVERRKPVTDEVRRRWTQPGLRLEPAQIAKLVDRRRRDPKDLLVAAELASRYLDLRLDREAAAVLRSTLAHYDPKRIARSADESKAKQLGQAYLQMARASVGNRATQVRYATLSYYMNPSVGFGKQIARIIAPEKFDHRPAGDFDNEFREGTLRWLRKERLAWLKE